MSILVKGLPMPESCKTCLFRRECQNPWGFWTNHCGLYTWCGITPDKIPEECRLVEIPTPHGELIDRSKIGLTNFECFMFAGDFREAFLAYINKVECAPTIIEAEGGEDE